MDRLVAIPETAAPGVARNLRLVRTESDDIVGKSLLKISKVVVTAAGCNGSCRCNERNRKEKENAGLNEIAIFFIVVGFVPKSC